MAGDRTLRIPPTASDAEAAAIVAAVEQWLAAEGRAAGGRPVADDPWMGRRFAFAGRLEKLTGQPGRVPNGAPGDPWTAVDRVGRMRGRTPARRWRDR